MLGRARRAPGTGSATAGFIRVTPPLPRDTGTFTTGLAGGEGGLGARHGGSVNKNPKHEQYPCFLGCSLLSKALSVAQNPLRDLLDADVVP